MGQRYHGPVVLITDALCYSATDIFAAGFQDHGIGPVLGVDDNTGAGGANVWTHDLLKVLLDTPPPGDGWPGRGNPFVDLPAGAQASGPRCGAPCGWGPHRAGTPVEDLGIVPTSGHRLTRADIVGVERRPAGPARPSCWPADRPTRWRWPSRPRSGPTAGCGCG